MLWLALHLPSLPLDIFRRAHVTEGAFAVADGEGNRTVVAACNQGALDKGVRAGMPVAAAIALDGSLRVLARDTAAEQAALERIAAWALQFTPVVSLSSPDIVLLEIEGSLQLFGGLNALRRRIADGIGALGYDAVIAIAPTPLAAQWFCRARLPLRVRHADALHASLAQVPVAVLDLAPEAMRLLEDLGVRTVGDCSALPRGGLARRLGVNVLDLLDRAIGRLPDPRPRYAPPAVYRASQLLPAPAQEAEMLLFAARRLLTELCGFLAATAQGVQRLALAFAHEEREATTLTLSLVAATRDAEHLVSVLRERLNATELPCPAVALALTSELLLPLSARSASLLPDASRQAEAALRLVERLRARLGEQGVVGVRTSDDYRPEFGWRACEPGAASPAQALDSRPLWLLSSPRALEEKHAVPCYEGRLALLAGPERIETGWWDDRHVERDYFVAANASQALLWIYKERAPGGKWYLHGFFAAFWVVVTGSWLLAG